MTYLLQDAYCSLPAVTSQYHRQIPEARMKLRAAVLLSDKLQHCCTELDTSHTESERKDLCGQVEQLKV